MHVFVVQRCNNLVDRTSHSMLTRPGVQPRDDSFEGSGSHRAEVTLWQYKLDDK
jgi:hypothetical protein